MKLLQTEKNESAANRRSFLKRGAAFAAGTAGAALMSENVALAQSAGVAKVTPGDIAILRFLAWAELIESDLWNQYSLLATNNAQYNNALSVIDPNARQYSDETTRDENSHWELINQFLVSVDARPVDIERFRVLPSPTVTGANPFPNLTNLTNLVVDTSWYVRYRSPANPDFGATFPQFVNLNNVPALLTSNSLSDLQALAVAATAFFHFCQIEQGGASLYPTLAQQVSNVEVLRILLSIGPVEMFHYAVFEGSLEALPAIDVDGLHFPDVKDNPALGANIMPKPCDFFSQKFPRCSVVRPTSTANSGAVAAVTALTNSGLFIGQNKEFFTVAMTLAQAADAATRAF